MSTISRSGDMKRLGGLYNSYFSHSLSAQTQVTLTSNTNFVPIGKIPLAASAAWASTTLVTNPLESSLISDTFQKGSGEDQRIDDLASGLLTSNTSQNASSEDVTQVFYNQYSVEVSCVRENEDSGEREENKKLRERVYFLEYENSRLEDYRRKLEAYGGDVNKRESLERECKSLKETIGIAVGVGVKNRLLKYMIKYIALESEKAALIEENGRIYEELEALRGVETENARLRAELSEAQKSLGTRVVEYAGASLNPHLERVDEMAMRNIGRPLFKETEAAPGKKPRSLFNDIVVATGATALIGLIAFGIIKTYK